MFGGKPARQGGLFFLRQAADGCSSLRVKVQAQSPWKAPNRAGSNQSLNSVRPRSLIFFANDPADIEAGPALDRQLRRRRLRGGLFAGEPRSAGANPRISRVVGGHSEEHRLAIAAGPLHRTAKIRTAGAARSPGAAQAQCTHPAGPAWLRRPLCFDQRALVGSPYGPDGRRTAAIL